MHAKERNGAEEPLLGNPTLPKTGCDPLGVAILSVQNSGSKRPRTDERRHLMQTNTTSAAVPVPTLTEATAELIRELKPESSPKAGGSTGTPEAAVIRVEDEFEGTLPFAFRMANFLAVVLPVAGLVTALAMLWGTAFNWVYLAIMTGMYLVTGLGITIGYHRLFTHKSFETGRFMTWFWAVAGSMAMEGPLLRWCALHRMHHQHSDHDLDPHSPHTHGGNTVWSVMKGFWHAHVGWLFTAYPKNLEKYTPDLRADPVIARVSQQFGLWVLVGMVIPAVLGGVLTQSWMGAFLGFLWGGPVRVFVVHHITWSINSVCHIWGSRPFNSHDESRNNAIFGILAFGEGWHNNHHAFPASARHGLAWWQFDSSYLVIKSMQLLGLARAVRVPDAARMEAKRRKPQAH
jgi:stearoyl-CoA desaturase (Delta-9 desaturase)